MKILLQLAGIFALCLVGEGISDVLPFAFPGSAIAMILLLLGFLFKVIKPSAVEETGNFLLGNMAVFCSGVGWIDGMLRENQKRPDSFFSHLYFVNHTDLCGYRLHSAADHLFAE